jgi:glutaredoxin-like YruB-family protein
MQIKIYSTPTCPWCVLTKNYFKSNQIEFEDINVAIDPLKAQEMVKLSGQMGVPVIKIDDEVLIGFDQKRIEKILDKKIG